MKEIGEQNTIRNDLAGECLLFRANVGVGWQGAGKPYIAARPQMYPLQRGDVVLRNARRFDTGLPEGFSDLFGLKPVVITPDMVGQTIGVFVGIECKSATGRAREQQPKFIAAVRRNGGRAGFARSTEHARDIIEGGTGCAQLNLLSDSAESQPDLQPHTKQRRGRAR